MTGFLLNLKNLDRRVIFLFVALSAAIPMMIDLKFPIFPSPNVKNLFDFMEKLPAGTRIFLSFDYDPGSMPELHPSAVAILIHSFKRGLKPICGANWPVGGDLAEQALKTALKTFQENEISSASGTISGGNLQKGRDYVNLGFKPGGVIHIKRISSDFLGPFPVDKDGTPTSSQEIFQNSGGEKFSMRNIGIIISFTGGTLGIENFISLAGDHKRPMGAACTSINIPKLYTFVQTGQLVGMTGGMPGAAEYETLTGFPGQASKGMGPQMVCHIVIMLFIILGNIVWLVESRQKKVTGVSA